MLAPSFKTLALLTLTGVAGTGSVDSAQLLQVAQERADQFDLNGALQAGREALSAGTASPDLTWAVYALLGRVEASMGREDEARADFGRALALSPAFELPAGSSPRLGAPFLQAREKTRPLKASVRSVREPSGEIRTELSSADDTWGLVHGMRLYLRQGERFARAVPLKLGREFVLWRCGELRCDYYVALVDAAGNELLHLGSPAVPYELGTSEAALAPIDAGGRTGAPAPWYLRPRTWTLAASVGLAATAGVFAWRFQAAQARLVELDASRATHSYLEAQSLDRARRRERTLSWVFLAGAGAAGGATILVW